MFLHVSLSAEKLIKISKLLFLSLNFIMICYDTKFLNAPFFFCRVFSDNVLSHFLIFYQRFCTWCLFTNVFKKLDQELQWIQLVLLKVSIPPTSFKHNKFTDNPNTSVIKGNGKIVAKKMLFVCHHHLSRLIGTSHWHDTNKNRERQ